VRVLVSGASGLIGSALTASLARAGATVVRLVRRAPRGNDEIAWDPARGRLAAAALEGADAVVHLAGESLAAHRWNDAVRARIRDSRVGSTRLLAETLARLGRPPAVMVSASASGIYGDRGDQKLTEDSAPGSGFLASLTRDWEAATAAAAARGIRVVHLRSGLVLSPRGGALARLLPIYRLGLGGPLGDGRAWVSWIALDDHVAVIRRAIAEPRLEGAVNASTPEPVTHDTLARTLGRELRRPAFLRVPRFALKLVLGAFAEEGLLASQRMVPARLMAAGHAFAFPSLEPALRHLLARREDVRA